METGDHQMDVLLSNTVLNDTHGIGRVVEELGRKADFDMIPSGESDGVPKKGVIPGMKRMFDFRAWFKKNISELPDIINFHFPTDKFRYYFVKDLLEDKHDVITVHTTTKGRRKYALKRTPMKYKAKKEISQEFLISHFEARIEKTCFDNCSNITCVSDKIKGELKDLYNIDNVTVIKNGIDYERIRDEKNRENGTPTLFYIGGLRAQKGIPYALEALEKLDQQYKFLIAGNGPLKKTLEDHIKKHGINAEMLGFVPDSDLPELYSKTDILVMPSLYEGLPMVALEGISCGIPIVGFKGAVLNEIVCDENQPFVCDDLDVDSLSKNISILLEDKNLRKEIGEKNQKRYENEFKAERMASDYKEYFKELILEGL